VGWTPDIEVNTTRIVLIERTKPLWHDFECENFDAPGVGRIGRVNDPQGQALI
jgi:hypothetical protein